MSPTPVTLVGEISTGEEGQSVASRLWFCQNIDKNSKGIVAVERKRKTRTRLNEVKVGRKEGERALTDALMQVITGTHVDRASPEHLGIPSH